jgi:Dolichyl-phosphate-mannose-protein mannosyltransferase
MPSAAARLRSSRLATLALPRLPLLAVLVVTAVLAYRMMMVNTPSLDETTYLSAGHVIWHNWMHGGTDTRYPTYFSGAPGIYPVIAAVADAIGGLLAARLLSLVFVLVTICVLHATARRLFGARAAAWAVLAFGTLAGTQFLAAVATYNAMALMLMALAVWISIRYAQSDRLVPHAGLLLGAPILAAANATKYATALYDPVVIAVVALVVAARYGRRQGIRCATMYAAVLAALLAAAVAVGGDQYVTGIVSTTLSRPGGTATVAAVFDDAGRWVGALAALSGLAVAVAALGTWRRRIWNVATVSSLALVAVLSVAVVLAPVEQARIHTSISLQQHVTFGAWFAAMALGSLLARLSGRRIRAWWRWTPALAAMVALGVVGHQQAVTLYHGQPNAATLTASPPPPSDVMLVDRHPEAGP